ncbi:YlzJ-like family protein [Evansella tamaricis]|uniref:YlzJ-like family protein n=1 Tax=Evansella tamaricis TaxID=2069301 RepID=A0ABS6JLE4_9BACI|nr:YlzJ-like family protein [Evansella tamaricis]MBU9714494.1 YlzJ-like family protein [Evansella tamaricis]
MILYTYQSQESIFPVDDSAFANVEMVDVPGGQLLLERQKESNNQYRIVRLLSTDPYMYLDQRYQPGQFYELGNQNK